MRRWVLVAAAALLGLTALPAGAWHGWPHGYCDENGNPVITEWPEGLPEDSGEARCTGKSFTWVIPDPNTYGGTGNTPEAEAPEDWAGFVIIVLNGREVINPYKDVRPYIAKGSGRTLVPIRYITEAIGGEVVWDHQVKAVTLSWGGRETRLVIGQREGVVNGVRVTLDQPPVIWKDRTFVPLRLVAEAFGARVDWYSSTSTVGITLPGATCAPQYCP